MNLIKISLLIYLLANSTKAFTKYKYEYLNKAREVKNIKERLFNEVAPSDFKYELVLDKLQNSETYDKLYLDKIDSILEDIENVKHRVTEAGDFIREHKFYERDWRSFNESNDINGEYYKSMILKASYDKHARFMISFPEKPIVREHPEVVKNCEKSAFDCIQVVSNVARLNKMHEVFHLSEKDLIAAEKIDRKKFPFFSYWQMFNFRATASYYLCWYTLKRNPLFTMFNKDCNETFMSVNNTKIDHYENLSKNRRDFDCAELSFCPDPCCGQAFYQDPPSEHQTNWAAHCQTHISNPCFNITKGMCELSHTENSNLNDLKRNLINVTCECPKGYKFSSMAKTCVDIDECLELSHDCFGFKQTCLNTEGKYMCVCQEGFRIKIAKSVECVVDVFSVDDDEANGNFSIAYIERLYNEL